MENKVFTNVEWVPFKTTEVINDVGRLVAPLWETALPTQQTESEKRAFQKRVAARRRQTKAAKVARRKNRGQA